MSDLLTPRQRQALEDMAAGEELVYDRGECYVGEEKYAPRTFLALLMLCAISQDSIGSIYYSINETGKQLLAGDTTNLKIIQKAMRSRKRSFETPQSIISASQAAPNPKWCHDR